MIPPARRRGKVGTLSRPDVCLHGSGAVADVRVQLERACFCQVGPTSVVLVPVILNVRGKAFSHDLRQCFLCAIYVTM